MAVNKNFVVKNGLEVAENLIFAVSDKVGIGSTAPLAKLDVRGNINATDVYSSGVTTVATAFNVGTGGTIIAGTTDGLVGFGTGVPEFIVDIKSPVSTGQTTLNVFGDVVISGDINIDNNFNLTGVSTFGGSATFSDDIALSGSIAITGIATAETFSGFSNLQSIHSATTKVFNVTVASKTSNHRYSGSGSGNAYYIDGIESPFITLTPGRTYRFLLSSSDMSSHPFRFYLEADRTTAYTNGVTSTSTYTEIIVTDTTPTVLFYQCSSHALMGNAVNTNSNVLFTSGIATVTSLSATNATVSGGVNVSGALTAASLVGDGSGITGFPAGSVGVSSGGTIIGTGATIVNFTMSGGNLTATPTSSGISTVNIQATGVTLGLAIALGG